MMNISVCENLKKYKVSILGEAYSLVSDEPESHIIQAVQLVDNILKDATKKCSDIEIRHLAILSALQLASKIIKIEQNNNRLINLIDSEIAQLSNT